MEKLELLAQRIDSLIQELVRLREENSKLGNEIRELKDELELGKMEKEDLQKQVNISETARGEACSRIDALIGRIQAALPDTQQYSAESTQVPLSFPEGQQQY